MEPKAFEKNINFYEIIVQPTFIIGGENTGEVMSTIFHKAFNKGCGLYKYKFKGITYYFDIKSFNNKSIFGLYCNGENDTDPMTQVRNHKTDEANRFKLPPDNVLEHYTFFYVDFDHKLMADIYNQKAPQLERMLKKYLFSMQCNVAIEPLCIQDITSYIGLFKNITEIDYSFSEISLPDMYRTLNECQNFDVDTGNYRIIMKLKKIGKNFQKDIQRIDTSKFTSFKIRGSSDSNIQQCIDLIAKSLTRTTKIKLTEDDVDNIERIRELLSSEALKVFDKHV